MHPSGGLIRALTCALLFSACGDCGDQTNNAANNQADDSFREAVGEWTPEACDSGEDDDGDGATDCADADCYTAESCVFAPSMAPPEMPAVGVLSFWDRWKWLFQGDAAPQRGVVDGAIAPNNIGTISGWIVDNDGEPLVGAAVSFAGHPDLGRTYTRADGRFDLAFDATRRLYVRVRAAGHITSDRRITGRVHRSASLDEVVLVPHEDEATTVDFSTTAWVAGTSREDDDGVRRTGVIIPEGRLAKLTFPNGATRPLDVINVRATEVTAGERGRDAMMADLPPQTLYTYAAEFSVDEAEAANASGVEFDQPVFIYVDNFLNMPVGSIVPSGYYDREQLAWEPSPNGYVVEVAEINGGEAVLSLGDGGLSDDDREALGLTSGELKRVAEQYEAGDTLWRIPTTHFSPLDFNWPGEFPPGALAALFGSDDEFPAQCSLGQERGSMIGCSSQVLGERIPLAGTPFALHYQSGRTAGRKPVLRIPVRPPGSTNVIGAKVRVSVAGQLLGDREYLSLGEVPVIDEFVWDGKDGFGRDVQGSADVEVEVGLVFQSAYVAPNYIPPTSIDEFPPVFADYISESGVAVDVGRATNVLVRGYTYTVSTGTYDVAREGLGGWTLDAQHRYDPVGQVMYYGNGQDLHASPDTRRFDVLLNAVGESDRCNPPGEGINATEWPAALLPNASVALAADGTVYFTDGNLLRAIDPGIGTVNTAGGVRRDDNPCDRDTMPYEDWEDGGRIDEIDFGGLLDIELGKDNRLYLYTGEYIARVESDDTVTKLVGAAPLGGNDEKPQDGAVAVDSVGEWKHFDASADGELFVATLQTIYRVTPGGLLRHVAGSTDATCDLAPCDDGRPARDVAFTNIDAFSVAPSGDIYLAERESLTTLGGTSSIRRIRPDGVIDTVAEVKGLVGQLEVGPGDTVYFSLVLPRGVGSGLPTYGAGVVLIDESGALVPVTGSFVNENEGLDPTNDDLFEPIRDGAYAGRPVASMWPFTVGANGEVVFIHDRQIVRLEEMLPQTGTPNFEIPSPDGRIVDEFAPNGRHLARYDGLTGAKLLAFEYDSAGRLLAATDVDGDTTTIERASDGQPTAIVGPNGVQWTLEVDEAGMLTRVISPEDESWVYAYEDGLMTAMTNPRGEQWTFDYDAAGRLVADTQPHGEASTLDRDADINAVTFRTPEGRETLYRETPPAQQIRSSSVTTGELWTRTNQTRGRFRTTTTQDGTVGRSAMTAHPAYGLIVGYPEASTVETPGGLVFRSEERQTATTSPEGLIFGLESWESTQSVGDGSQSTQWTGSDRSLTSTTDEGRRSTVTLDEDGRPVELQAADFAPVTVAYDEQGRPSETTVAERAVSFAYDDNGYLAAVTTDDGTAMMSRDQMGRIIEATRPDATVLGFGWDPLGNLTDLTAPGKTVDYEMANDVRGNLLTMTTPMGRTTSYELDLDYRPIGMTLADGRQTSASYDDSNRVDEVTLDGTVYDYRYAETGQLARIVSPGPNEVRFDWDGPLPLSVETDSPDASGTVSWTWQDGTFYLDQADINGVPIDYAYDTDGMPVTIGDEILTYRDGTALLASRTVGSVATEYAYNEYGELDEMTTTVGGAEVLNRVFTYDSLGRIATIDEAANLEETVYVYDYDLIGQLVGTTASGARNYTNSYTYDENGNRTAVANGIDDLAAADIDHDADDRLLRYGAATYTYNEAGQRTSATGPGGTTDYVYGVSGELQAVSLPGGTEIIYSHDALQRRIARAVDGTTTHRWIYADRINPVAEVDADGNTITTFVYGTGINVPDYMVRDGVTYAFVRDHLGSVRFVIDSASGDVAQQLTYDEYGNVLFDSNPGFQPFGYAGGLYDPATELVRFGARDYDPRIGRWTAPDPIGFGGGQANLYVYVANSPILFADPAGEVALGALLVGALAGGVIGAAVGAGSNVINLYGTGVSLTEAAQVGAAGGFVGGAIAGATTAGTGGLGTFAGIGLGGFAGGALIEAGNIKNGLTNPADQERAIAAAALKTGTIACGAAAVGPGTTTLPQATGTGLIVAVGRAGGAALSKVGEFFWNFDTHVHGPRRD